MSGMKSEVRRRKPALRPGDSQQFPSRPESGANLERSFDDDANPRCWREGILISLNPRLLS